MAGCKTLAVALDVFLRVPELAEVQADPWREKQPGFERGRGFSAYRTGPVVHQAHPPPAIRLLVKCSAQKNARRGSFPGMKTVAPEVGRDHYGKFCRGCDDSSGEVGIRMDTRNLLGPFPLLVGICFLWP